MKALVKLPVALAGLAGFALAAWLTPTRLRVPLALFVAGLLTFVLVGARGPVGHQPLPARAVADGDDLRRRRGRAAGRCSSTGGAPRLDVRGAAAPSLGVVLDGAARRPRRGSTTSFASAATRALRSPGCSTNPKVRAAARCGPVLTPNHQLDAGRALDPRPARGSRDRAQRRCECGRGHDRTGDPRREPPVFLRQGLDPDDDSVADALRNLPPAGLRADRLHAVLFGLRALP